MIKRLLYNKLIIIIHFLFNLNLRYRVKPIIEGCTYTNHVYHRHILQYYDILNNRIIICTMYDIGVFTLYAYFVFNLFSCTRNSK